MTKRFVKIFKCRGCGRNVSQDNVDLSSSSEWCLRLMFESGDEFAEVSGGSQLSSEPKYLLHRCDPEKLCLCDFVGWKQIEVNDD